MNRYDTATRIWTTVLGVFIAAVIDWIAVVNPARAVHPAAPGTGWWTFGLAIATVAPASWLIGKLRSGQHDHMVLWACVLIFVIVCHVIPLHWAQIQT